MEVKPVGYGVAWQPNADLTVWQDGVFANTEEGAQACQNGFPDTVKNKVFVVPLYSKKTIDALQARIKEMESIVASAQKFPRLVTQAFLETDVTRKQYEPFVARLRELTNADLQKESGNG